MAKRSLEVYQFKITLKGIRPPVWRRIQVPETYSFWDLHVAIQDAMGWLDSHLHSFQVTNPATGTLETIGIPDDEWGSRGIQPGWKKKIAEYFSSLHPRACYVYDPGDDWEHDVVYEKTLPRDDREFYPRCIAGRRSTPPEDCGGPWGYANLLKVLEDPSDEQYEEALEWAGDAFDPECFNKNEILFSDPRKRLEAVLPDDGETDRTEEAPGSEWKELPLSPWMELWEKVRRGESIHLEPGERKIARIMEEHKEIFTEALEKARTNPSAEEDIGPLFHVLIHMTVEDQIEKGKPREVLHFYEAMKQQGSTRHEAVHLAGSLWATLFLESTYEKKPFGARTYRSRLKQLKNMKPKEIWELLKKEQSRETKE
ncbi:MAG TPA: plasmid pRiA4b ORF-3 family protein [Syntrophales bacterium]|nr:plasmid pRiA4b ORF-3 family protein [Syntrophales bacterium]HPX12628.1 plasmid pRiA4b ORF-3 family protein [Syntrophales bacterium]HQN77538.1 plasmid pRiA4b ORF-3 family protein [Syntrophales bacterium]HQQ26494.1 plasmid pRiA4b ORF-3 family protein [Syntrophales bacterium]